MPTTKPHQLLAGLLTAVIATTGFAIAPQAQAHGVHRQPVTHHHHQHPQPVAPQVRQEVTVNLETAEGVPLETFFHQGSMYVAGNLGQRYNIRLTNNTAERVEAVVTVDGRDVISGQLGNYRKQRGYVIGPYGSVTVEGFRQSLNHVAAFRFSDLTGSYSAQRGTPQHVGVLGVAVFKERKRRIRRKKHKRPVAALPPPRPYYEPYAGADGASYNAPAAEASTRAPATKDSPGRASVSDSSAPKSAPSGGFAPAPRQLGTQYGETHHNSVTEVTFKRRRRRRPDSLTTIYYDSRDGLRARGIPVDPPHFHPAPYPSNPQPFPEGRFAPPPR